MKLKYINLRVLTKVLLRALGAVFLSLIVSALLVSAVYWFGELASLLVLAIAVVFAFFCAVKIMYNDEMERNGFE